MNTYEHDEIRRRLESIPEVEPQPYLWERVEAARRRRLRHRKIAAGCTGLACVLVFASLAWPLMDSGDTPAIQVSSLEPSPIDENLAALDRALQTAYRRGASDEELAPLWNKRQRLVQHESLANFSADSI